VLFRRGKARKKGERGPLKLNHFKVGDAPGPACDDTNSE